jgi:hypothetical protein
MLGANEGKQLSALGLRGGTTLTGRSRCCSRFIEGGRQTERNGFENQQWPEKTAVHSRRWDARAIGVRCSLGHVAHGR